MKEKEISAEAYLELLYRGAESKWIVYDKGLFYRNYSGDMMSVDEDAGTVTLSRNGWLRYLPQEMISPENEIVDRNNPKGRKQADAVALDELVRRRISLLNESLVPFDTFGFRMRLELEMKLQEVLGEKMSWILRTFYDFDLEAEHDGYVRKAAMLLPYVPGIRGDVRFVRKLIETLTGHEVRSRFAAYGGADNTRCAVRKLFLDIIIDGLDPGSYRREMDRIRPLAGFLEERFLPFDLMCEIGIKGRNPELFMLDYNYCL